MKDRNVLFVVLVMLAMVLIVHETARAGHYIGNGNGTVTDTRTKLIWQQAGDGQRRSFNEASSYCNTLIKGGYSDWRIPRIDELETIVDYTRYSASIDSVFQSLSDSYWSGTTCVNSPENAWVVNFSNGYDDWLSKSGTSSHVRCVRGGPWWSFDPSNHLASNTTNTLKDTHRGNIWQKADDGIARNWEAAKSYCKGLSLDGYSDWKLPGIDELKTIVDYSRYDPARPDILPGKSMEYWSGTTNPVRTDNAWLVYFYYGDDGWNDKSDAYYVRCLRGVPPGSFGTLSLSKSGIGTGKASSSPAGIDCGQDCGEKYEAGTSVTLRAVADAGSIFKGWSAGGCSAIRQCTVTITTDITITANFAKAAYSISGTVKKEDGSPLPGLGIYPGVITGPDGTYKIPGLSNGVYTISPSKDQYTFIPASRSVNVNGAYISGEDFVGASKPMALSDLVVTKIEGADTARVGKATKVFVTVRNQGQANVKKSFKVKVVILKIAKIDPANGEFLKSFILPVLKAGRKTDPQNIRVMIPRSIKSGSYRLGAIADSTDKVVEANEANNGGLSSKSIKITR